ncbi:purine phosphorylase [Chitiniphilus purpureus]|uniref:Purine phosphorylase n=1 Tax=Chitiniphilus purpureus TaxID=2981137 RepID=A0ABY6DL65_9NEIS|nr:purine phosphorylase [Chitiniphilus sp. CD1]UXY15072.1 purine phosphorylase [Chitiniphilus sp. CD1]
MKIVVLFPTRTEARHFTHPAAEVAFCGIGLSAAAYATARLIHERRPDVLILAGIAGVYPHSRFTVGETVLVASEREADLGLFTPSGFCHLSQVALDMDFAAPTVLHCPYLPATPPLPLAHGNSANAALAPFIASQDADVESMEGAAFFHACLQAGQRFYQVRAISNVASVDHAPWDIDGAVRALAQGLTTLIGHLAAHG